VFLLDLDAGQILQGSRNKGVSRAMVQRTRCSTVSPLAHLLFRLVKTYAPFHRDERSYLMRTVHFVAFEYHQILSFPGGQRLFIRVGLNRVGGNVADFKMLARGTYIGYSVKRTGRRPL
jgi:hypothetical protein